MKLEKKEKKIRMSTYISNDIYMWLSKLVKKYKMSKSEIINNILNDEMDKFNK